MRNSIHNQEKGPWINNLSQQSETDATSPPLFLSSVLPEEDEVVDEDGDSVMFATFLNDASKDAHRCQTYPFSSATPSHPQSSPSLAFTSPRPSSSSSSSCSSSLAYSSYSSCTPFNHLPSPVPEHEEASSSWSPTSPNSPDFSTSRDQDPFGVASLLAFGRVDSDHVSGGFEQDQQHDRTDDLVEADRLQWDETVKTREGATTSSTPPVFAPPVTSDHSNPYYELGRYHLRFKSPSSSSSSSNFLILHPPPHGSLPPNPQRKSQSLLLRTPQPYPSPSTSSASRPRPRSSSFGVMPTFLERALVASSTSLPATQKEKEEENFETETEKGEREDEDRIPEAQVVG